MKFVILQILIVLLFVVGIILFFGKIKKKNKAIVAGLCVITVLASMVSNGLVGMIPMPNDIIQLTATGQQNSEALNNEVSLKDIVVDDIHYEINNAIEGKWFWQGDRYMWRNENDSRKPDGVTHSVTIEIPMGNSRQLVFNNNRYRGIVEITYDGESETYDLYSENDADVSIDIPGNGIMTAYAIKLARLLLFALLIILFLAYFVFAVYRFEYELIRKWFGRNWDKLVYLAISAACFFVMFNNGKYGSFWYDEVWSLGWIYDGQFNSSLNLIYKWICLLTFKIAPYGQEYLLIGFELLTAAAVYVFGLIGSEFKSKRLGVILSTLCAVSSTVILQCGNEFRPYAILLLGVTLSFYFFIKKSKQMGNEKISTLILYGISLVISMDAHAFGLLTSGLFIIADIILLLLKKSGRKCWISWIAPFIYGIIWLFTEFGGLVSQINNNGWSDAPTIKGIFKCIFWLCGNSNIFFIVLVLGLVIIVGTLAKRKLSYKSEFTDSFVLLTAVGIPCAIFILNCFYSSVINPENSLFIERYFVSAIVFVIFTAGLAVDAVISFAINVYHGEKRMAEVICTVSLVVSCCCIGWYRFPYDSHNENYKEAANYLMSQSDIYSSTTLCVVYDNFHAMEGDAALVVNNGFEYYLSHNGKYDSINHVDRTADRSGYNVIYAVYIHCYDSLIEEEDEKYSQVGYDVYSVKDSIKVKKYIM